MLSIINFVLYNIGILNFNHIIPLKHIQSNFDWEWCPLYMLYRNQNQQKRSRHLHILASQLLQLQDKNIGYCRSSHNWELYCMNMDMMGNTNSHFSQLVQQKRVLSLAIDILCFPLDMLVLDKCSTNLLLS